MFNMIAEINESKTLMDDSAITCDETIPIGQINVRGIFVDHSHEIFPIYSEKVPYENPRNIPK